MLTRLYVIVICFINTILMCSKCAEFQEVYICVEDLCYSRLFYKFDLDAFKMHSNFKKCIYAYNLDALKMCSNFKKCTFAYKIVCYSRLIYKYDLDAMLML